MHEYKTSNSYFVIGRASVSISQLPAFVYIASLSRAVLTFM